MQLPHQSASLEMYKAGPKNEEITWRWRELCDLELHNKILGWSVQWDMCIIWGHDTCIQNFRCVYNIKTVLKEIVQGMDSSITE